MFFFIDDSSSVNRLGIHTCPSVASFTSLQVPFSNYHSSMRRLPRTRSIAGSMKVFVLQRSSKFLRSEVWSILVTLALQDGPFLTVRLIAIIVYHVRSFLTYFFTFKNFLILVFQTYRILAICFEKDEYEEAFHKKVTKMKHMSMAAKQLGIPLNRKI